MKKVIFILIAIAIVGNVAAFVIKNMRTFQALKQELEQKQAAVVAIEQQLTEQYHALKQMEQDITILKQQNNIEAYNRLVTEYNALGKKYEALGAEHQKRAQEYNAVAEKMNNEIKRMTFGLLDMKKMQQQK